MYAPAPEGCEHEFAFIYFIGKFYRNLSKFCCVAKFSMLTRYFGYLCFWLTALLSDVNRWFSAIG